MGSTVGRGVGDLWITGLQAYSSVVASAPLTPVKAVSKIEAMNKPESCAAYINAQVACALIQAKGMEAENQQRELRGESMAYMEEDFAALIEEYGIHHNAVLGMLNDAEASL